MSAFLSEQEKFELTGYRRPADQIRWLQRNRIPYYVQRAGRPVVRRDMAEALPKGPELGMVR